MTHKGPQRRHHVLPDQGGRDQMETLCNIVIVPIRDNEERIQRFVTLAGHTIQTMFDHRGVNCNTCQHVWRNIKGEARG